MSNRVEKNFAKLTSFSEDMRARGREPRSVWLNRAAGTVTPGGIADAALQPGHAGVYRFHRIRYADDAPMALEYATVLAGCLPSLDAVETSLYEALENASGNRPVRALQRLRAVLLTAEQAKLLKAQERDAGLLVARVGLPQGRQRGRVLAVLLPRRHLRFRRRAQRVSVSDPGRVNSMTRMFQEAAEAAERRPPPARARTPMALRDARRKAAPGAAARRGHLRARQLGSRRDLREISHRDAYSACSPPPPRRR